jgi:hypothetical protein
MFGNFFRGIKRVYNETRSSIDNATIIKKLVHKIPRLSLRFEVFTHIDMQT